MIYQAQGVSMTTTNTASYGNITSYNSAGLYEFKYVQSVSANIITFQSAFTNSYSLAGKPQLIKVPQYSTLTINAGASTKPKEWKDTIMSSISYRFGGLVVIHASTIVNNGTITANGSGFRGGGTAFQGGGSTVNVYVSTNSFLAGEKGESLFGYQPEYDLNNGRFGKGSAVNGGGGGNGHNAGGGGGANGFNGNAWTGNGVMIIDANNPLTAWSLDPEYILNSNAITNSSGGGRGGYSFGGFNANATTDAPGSALWGGDLRRNAGGRGGRPLTNIDPETRIYFGGGGGTADINNNVSGPGGDGGGIIYLIPTNGISGTGIISANGDAGASTFSSSCDGASGGGGGGSIVIKSSVITSQSISASGGRGGDQNFIYPLFGNTYASTPNENDGPGGGGGGGLFAAPVVVTNSVNGGENGISLSPAVTEMLSNGSTRGAAGQTNSVSLSLITFTPTPVVITSNTPCVGSSLVFSATPAATYTWSGPLGFSSSLQNPTLVNASAQMAGTYSLMMSYTANCFSAANYTIPVVVNLPSVISVTNTTICAGNTGTLTANGSLSYTWNPGNSTGTTFTATPLVTTIYSVTGSGANGCTASVISTITVSPTLTLNVSANDFAACVGNTISLTASASGGIPGYTYTWTNGPATSIYNLSLPAGNYVYTISSIDAIGCSTSKTISVDFISNPVVSVPGVSICPGSIATLSATGANTYTWLPSLVTGNNFTVNPLSTSVYSVIGIAITGCSATANTTVFVKPVPSLSFVTATITCANLGSATVSTTGGIGPFSYTWTPTLQTSSIATGLYPGTYSLSVFDNSTNCTINSYTTFTSLVPFTSTVSSTNSLACNSVNTGTASIALSGGSGSQNYLWTNPNLSTQTPPTISSLSAGIYTVSVTDGITFCNLTHTFQITQPPALTLNINPSSALACVGIPVFLTATNSGGIPGYTYSWTAGVSLPSHTVTEVSGGTYVYTVQSTDANTCIATNTVPVLFVDYPLVGANSASVCLGSAATLTASGANTYTWFPSVTSGSSYSVIPLSNSFYTVTGGVSDCNSSYVTSVVVYSLPVAFISGSTTVCEGLSLNLSGSGGSSYSWSGPMNTATNSPVFVINTTALTHNGIYSLTVISPEGCVSSASTSVTILPKPAITVSGASVCIGMSATMSVFGGVSYLWNGPDGSSFNSTLVSIPLVTTGNMGIYTVVVTGSNSCNATAQVQLLGYPYALPVPVITTPSVICLHSGFMIQGSGGSGYLWNGPGGFSSTSPAVNLVATNLAMSGVYTLTVKNNFNCVASTSSSITVYPLPVGKLVSSNSNQCLPFCSDVRVDITNQPYPIVSTSFLLKDVPVSDTAFNYCFVTAGDYPFKIKLTDVNGCTGISSLTISAWQLPKADFEYSPAIPVENVDYVSFRNTSSGVSLSEFNWHFIANEGDSSRTRDPEYLFEKAGTFPIALVVKNKWGCSDTVVKSIHVIDNFSFYAPNSFSPNGDGINDIFQPKGVGIIKYRLDIFDRWGEKLFTSDDFLTGWDGTFKGIGCKMDVYVWKIELTNPSGKQMSYAGHVSILNK